MTFYSGKLGGCGSSSGNAKSWAKRKRKDKLKPAKTLGRKAVGET